MISPKKEGYLDRLKFPPMVVGIKTLHTYYIYNIWSNQNISTTEISPVVLLWKMGSLVFTSTSQSQVSKIQAGPPDEFCED